MRSGFEWDGSVIQRCSARALILSAVLLALMTLCVGNAIAEDYTYAPGALTPDNAAMMPDSAAGATAYGGTFECTVPFANVQAAPSGYVVGNCKSGVHLRRQAKSSMFDGTFWDGGYIFGNVAGCGWIQVSLDQQVSDTTGALCDPNSIGYRLNEYAVATNDNTTPKSSCSDVPNATKCSDGTTVTSITACYAYRNFRPWASGQGVSDAYAILNSGKSLRWRYITKYGATNFGNSKFVMVRDPSLGAGQGNWYFVQRSCLPANLPGYKAVS